MTPDPLFRCWESTSGANGAAPGVGPYALTRIWTTAGLTRCVKASSELLSSLNVSKSFWCEEAWARRTEVGTKLQVIHSQKAHTVILRLMRHPFLYGKILFSLNQNSSREFPIVGALRRSTPAYVNSRAQLLSDTVMRNLFVNQRKGAPSVCAILGPACRQVNAPSLSGSVVHPAFQLLTHLSTGG